MATAALIERDLTVPDNEAVSQAADAVRALEDFLKRHPDIATDTVTFVPAEVSQCPEHGHRSRCGRDERHAKGSVGS